MMRFYFITKIQTRPLGHGKESGGIILGVHNGITGVQKGYEAET
jgi:hypothetical protein